MKRIIPLLALILPSCGGNYPPLDTVPSVDLERYMGTWHEIARLPNSFQKHCWNSTAEYALMDGGTVRVINRCEQDSSGGEIDEAVGKAWVVEGSGNAKLKVSFFWPFRGDYWILELDPDYRWVAVGTPSREYLWILARERSIDDELYTTLLRRLKDKGFDTSRLITRNDMSEKGNSADILP